MRFSRKPEKGGAKPEKNEKPLIQHKTFFPKDWSAQQIVGAINEAYAGRCHDHGNSYIGAAANGMPIQMYLSSKGKIVHAFPICSGGSDA